jgi:hypothetical protein
MHKFTAFGLLATYSLFAASAFAAPGKGVEVVADEANRRVDITIDGEAFTSYIWPTTLKKPVLYPLITDEGITVTRGYPLNLRPGERVDHPHHAGLWFNYESVNGFDFWNNSEAIKPEDRAKMGTILHTEIVSTKSGTDRGELVVEALWVTGDNKQILTQTTRYLFLRRAHARIIDESITLKALDHVLFKDAKDGALGLRVASWLESPDEKGGIFMDASGRPTKVDAAPAGTATGVYLTSEGVKGTAAWGTRGRRPHRHHRHPRPAEESRLSNLLAYSRLRTLRRQSPRPQHLRPEAARNEHDSGEESDGEFPLPRDPVFAHCHRGRDESRSGQLLRRSQVARA